MSEQDGPSARVALTVVDLLVYVVVLNLFVEYLPQVLAESFTLSLLTAALLKGVLEVVVTGKDRMKERKPVPMEFVNHWRVYHTSKRILSWDQVN